MSDLLARLAERALGLAPTVQPLLRSRFAAEPSGAFPPAAPLEETVEVDALAPVPVAMRSPSAAARTAGLVAPVPSSVSGFADELFIRASSPRRPAEAHAAAAVFDDEVRDAETPVRPNRPRAPRSPGEPAATPSPAEPVAAASAEAGRAGAADELLFPLPQPDADRPAPPWRDAASSLEEAPGDGDDVGGSPAAPRSIAGNRGGNARRSISPQSPSTALDGVLGPGTGSGESPAHRPQTRRAPAVAVPSESARAGVRTSRPALAQMGGAMAGTAVGEGESEARPVVQVSIGRVEVRAPPAEPVAPAPRGWEPPRLSLADYLSRERAR